MIDPYIIVTMALALIINVVVLCTTPQKNSASFLNILGRAGISLLMTVGVLASIKSIM